MSGFLKRLLVLIVMNFAWCFGQLRADEPTAGQQVMQSLVSPALPAEKFGYLLFLPKDYGTDDRKWPVMLFLHGSGERGDDLKLVKVHGTPKLVESQPAFPFIVVSPQCPKDHSWSGEMQQHLLAELLDHVLTHFATDPQRVVVTGLSMGVFGSWELTARYPNRFSAAVPICGGGDPENAPQLKNVPFWVFHGGKDFGVPLKLSQEMIDAVKNAGGQAKFTIYADAGHDSWTETYNNPAVYEWLLKQRRTDPAPLPTAKPDRAFARVGSIEFSYRSKTGSDSFSATIMLSTSSDLGSNLRERLEGGVREKLLKELLRWAVEQPLEELIGKAGRDKTRLAVADLFRQSDIPTEVLIDLYFVRHNDRLRLESR